MTTTNNNTIATTRIKLGTNRSEHEIISDMFRQAKHYREQYAVHKNILFRTLNSRKDKNNVAMIDSIKNNMASCRDKMIELQESADKMGVCIVLIVV